MRRVFLCFVGLVMSVSAYAQAPAGQSGMAAVSPAPGTPTRPVQKSPKHAGAANAGARYKPEIRLNTPIVTLNGVCAQTDKSAAKSKPPAPCKTVVTRGQLDALLDAIEPNAAPKTRQQFAINYARLLAAEQIAEDQHLDQNPDVLRAIQTQQKLARLQVLNEALLEKMQIQAQHVPASELQAYYKKYFTTFEQAAVRRLAIALNSATVSGKPLDKSEVKAKMEELRALAVQGTSFEELQARAFNDLGIKDPLPPTSLMLKHRGELTPEENSVFEMDPGATTPVFETQGVVLILQVVSHGIQSLDDAREQIEAVLFPQRMQEGLREAGQGITADFNLKYLEAKTQPELFPTSAMAVGMRRSMLSSLHVQP